MSAFSHGPMQGDRSRYRCGHCKKALDGYSGDAETYPDPGDLGVCAYCGTLQQYVVGGVEPLRDEVLRTLPPDLQERLKRTSEAVKAKRDGPPAAYLAQIEAMAAAAKAWVAAHPAGCLQLNQINPDDLPIAPAARRQMKTLIAAEGYDKMALIVDLDFIAPYWAGNPDTLELLRAMDAASGKQATHTMTKVALDLAFSVELHAPPAPGAN